MSILIKNAFVLTMALDHQPPVKADILIEGQHITKIGDIDPSALTSGSEVIDAAGMLAMPGLINCHNHSPMSLLRGFCDNLKLMDWLERKMLPAEANMTEEDIYWGSLLAIAEMIKSGTTCFADMYVHMDAVAHAVEDAGIRASLARGLVFKEDDGGKRLSEGLALIEQWSGAADGRITTMLGPHAPYTCPPEPLQEVMQWARSGGIPLHIHLAETREEVHMMREKYDRTPTEYLADLGMFDGSLHVLLAHGVHMNEHDLDLIRPNRGGISHNPTSNLMLGCGIAPINSMLSRGITVGLGTDGAGSSTTLDLFKEIKAAAGLQKATRFDPTSLDAETALRMATVNGAKLLGLHQQIGTLEIGKKADLILINMNQPHLVPQHNLVSLAAYAVHGADVDTTIVNGTILMRHRRLLTLDEGDILREAQKRGAAITAGI